MVVLRGGGKVGKLDRIWVIMCVGMEGLCLQPKGNEGVMASNFFFFFFWDLPARLIMMILGNVKT